MRTVTIRGRIAAAVLAGACLLAACSSPVAGTATGTGSSGSAASSGAANSAPAASSAAASSEQSASASAGSSEASSSESAPASSEAPSASSAPAESSSAPETSSEAPASSSAGSVPAGVAAFAARVQHGVSSIKSVTGTLKLTTGPLNESGSFAQTMSGGEVDAMDMTVKVSGSGSNIDMKVRVVGDKSYLGPASTLQQMGVNTGGKPWVELSSSSSNSVLSQMAKSIGQTKNTAGLRQYAVMIVSASKFAKVGVEPVDGTTATHYKVTIDLAKFAATGGADSSSLAAAQQAGLKEIPLDIWLDSADRPVKIQEKFSVQGQSVDIVLTMGKFNAPLTIAAPPAKDIAKG